METTGREPVEITSTSTEVIASSPPALLTATVYTYRPGGIDPASIESTASVLVGSHGQLESLEVIVVVAAVSESARAVPSALKEAGDAEQLQLDCLFLISERFCAHFC